MYLHPLHFGNSVSPVAKFSACGPLLAFQSLPFYHPLLFVLGSLSTISHLFMYPSVMSPPFPYPPLSLSLPPSSLPPSLPPSLLPSLPPSLLPSLPPSLLPSLPPSLSLSLPPSLPPPPVNWLTPNLTFSQQGLLDDSLLLTLRKKFFFSDENVNTNDPVQLHLLYVQVWLVNTLYPYAGTGTDMVGPYSIVICWYRYWYGWSILYIHMLVQVLVWLVHTLYPYAGTGTGADPGGGMGGSCPPLSKWSMTSCAYNCQPLLCFSLANTHTSRMPRWYLKNDVKSGRSTYISRALTRAVYLAPPYSQSWIRPCSAPPFQYSWIRH